MENKEEKYKLGRRIFWKELDANINRRCTLEESIKLSYKQEQDYLEKRFCYGGKDE